MQLLRRALLLLVEVVDALDEAVVDRRVLGVAEPELSADAELADAALDEGVQLAHLAEHRAVEHDRFAQLPDVRDAGTLEGLDQLLLRLVGELRGAQARREVVVAGEDALLVVLADALEDLDALLALAEVLGVEEVAGREE